MKNIEKINLKNFDGDNVEYEMYIDARSLMMFERIYRSETKNGKATFINSLPLLQEGDMTFICCLMASTLRKPEKKQPVGLDHVIDNLPLLENLETMMVGVQNCLEDLKVEKDEMDKGK
jgi:hypothetical protein|nr:MAG TPA: hypothetical protein [Caudoviricetes sp.]